MLLPMPAMPAPSGTPSSYAKSRTYAVLAILVLQSAVILMRLILQLDILGGFMMGLATGLGWYAWKEDMHITFLCYWGAMCFINGIFDVVKFIDFWVHDPMPLFSNALTFGYNLNSATYLLIPLVTLPGALIAWYLYKDQTEGGDYGHGGGYGRSSTDERAPLWRQSNFEAFGGNGQRLGAN
ncbi:unnamed protein product [Polarella glacialis]|uniref:Uncharacterized protein n=1 Tax=Polarella glacialis TaxID=89957 RepID=A0A813GL01_POLGL|nr:unnamed protein product [Polarella glacialis]|mmetsp:Transcript_1843/g.2840  ORF Transcript_1843/g.2840 Transcript_1843/m.2840 type:complete len:182 (-) Transcript_1843:87-632(-)